MILLREYQDRAIAGLRDSIRRACKAPLLVSPTGSGKTVMFSYLTDKLVQAGKRVFLLAHRDELIEQISRTLASFGVRHGVIAAGSDYFDPRLRAHVAGVFTLVRRLPQLPVPDYVIVDEAHHCIAASTWGKVLAYWRALNPAMVVIGVTATPERLSGEGLGQVFDDLVLGPSTAELIAAGHLAPYKLYAPPPRDAVDLSGLHSRGGDFVRSEAAGRMDKPTITGNAVAHYRKHCNGAPAVAFCASIEHAAHVAEAFAAEGFRAVSIDGKLDKAERKRRVEDFGRGHINVLVSCDLISEGFDVPGIVGAILLRPTQSLALFLQQVGRALRTAPGKSHAIILDHVGNTQTHGLPDDEREWSLEGFTRKKKAQDPDNLPVKQCKHCYAINRSIAQKCRECGEPFAVKARMVAEVEGELQETDVEALRREQRQRQGQRQGQATTVEAMVRDLGYTKERAEHIAQARADKAALRNRVLELAQDVRRATGELLVTPAIIRALKPKELRTLADTLEDRLVETAHIENARRDLEVAA